jgi:hypothetical protein
VSLSYFSVGDRVVIPREVDPNRPGDQKRWRTAIIVEIHPRSNQRNPRLYVRYEGFELVFAIDAEKIRVVPVIESLASLDDDAPSA